MTVSTVSSLSLHENQSTSELPSRHIVYGPTLSKDDDWRPLGMRQHAANDEREKSLYCLVSYGEVFLFAVMLIGTAVMFSWLVYASYTHGATTPNKVNRLAHLLNVTNFRTETPQYQALEWMGDHSVENDDMERLKQSYALLVVQLATGADMNTMDGDNECQWRGVTCRDNVVVSLDVTNTNSSVQGALPSEIGLFIMLERLFVRHKGLTGTIPTTLYSLTNLYALSLSPCSLSSTLSESIANLQQLHFLHLTKSGIGGTLPESLGRLTHLRRLYLAQNPDLTGSLPSQTSQLTRLEHFDIRGTQVSGSIPAELCQSHLSDVFADCDLIACLCCEACN